MRDTLFRGKYDDNQWYYGYHFTSRDINGKTRHYISYEQSPGEDSKYVEVFPETVGQCTGLKDKNDKYIFVGDIVRWTSRDSYLVGKYTYYTSYGYNSLFVVTNLDSGFTLRKCQDNAPEIPNANGKIDNYTFWNHQNQLEVIGNIFDNPELLEV